MKIIIAVAISIFIFCASLFGAHAASDLSHDDIQHFMNAMKPLQELAEKYDMDDNQDMPAESSNSDDFSPMSRALNDVKGHKAYAEFETIIRGAGFSSPEQWATVGDRVMRAYMSLKMTQEMTAEKKQELQETIAEIEKNEYLSPEIKQQLLTGMKQMMALQGNMSDSSKSDQETLKPYLARLERLFEE